MWFVHDYDLGLVLLGSEEESEWMFDCLVKAYEKEMECGIDNSLHVDSLVMGRATKRAKLQSSDDDKKREFISIVLMED